MARFGELEEFCALFSGQILEIERVVPAILCCRSMRMSGTPKIGRHANCI